MKRASYELIELQQKKADLVKTKAESRKLEVEARDMEVRYFFSHLKTMTFIAIFIFAYNYDKFETIIKVIKELIQ